MAFKSTEKSLNFRQFH